MTDEAAQIAAWRETIRNYRTDPGDWHFDIDDCLSDACDLAERLLAERDAARAESEAANTRTGQLRKEIAHELLRREAAEARVRALEAVSQKLIGSIEEWNNNSGDIWGAMVALRDLLAQRVLDGGGER